MIERIQVSKTDITEYSINELSLLVFNNEYLYMHRHHSEFLNLLSDLYNYTEEQLEVLKQDLEDEEL